METRKGFSTSVRKREVFLYDKECSCNVAFGGFKPARVKRLDTENSYKPKNITNVIMYSFNMNTKEFLDAVLPKFEGTRGELLEAINKLAEETHCSWVRDIEARETLEPHFEA